MHPKSARFHELVDSLHALHDQKQEDYGRGDDPFANIRASQEFGLAPWVGAMVRANDKLTRIKNAATGKLLANEPIVDSFRDLAVYAVIAWVLWEESSTLSEATEKQYWNPLRPGAAIVSVFDREIATGRMIPRSLTDDLYATAPEGWERIDLSPKGRT